MFKQKKLIKIILLLIFIVPVISLSLVFIPGVQKYIIKNHLSTWISEVKVNSFHVTPFNLDIEQLHFKYKNMTISIAHLDSSFSPFNLLEQRIKINQFKLDEIVIDDNSPVQQQNKQTVQAAVLFPGLFPYLDSRFIIDIKQLNIHARYNSLSTGAVKLQVSAQNVNEKNDAPILLKVNVADLPGIEDIKNIALDSTIHLQQHNDSAIDQQQSTFNISLTNHQGIKQDFAIQLAMKQLAAPDRWASFPLDKHRSRYLRNLLHPESIKLKIKHRAGQKLLSEINYLGRYNGNEGVISGSLKINTDKDFLSHFGSLKLPKIEALLDATFSYNTRRLQGSVKLNDSFKIENYTSFISTEKSSLPEKIVIKNHLTARINENNLVIEHFLFDLFNQQQKYINIVTHKPISADLDDLPHFLEQQNSELASINIQQLSLDWFNDFIPEHRIKQGVLDGKIDLAVNNKTLMLKSSMPIQLSQLKIQKKLNSQTPADSLTKTQNTKSGITHEEKTSPQANNDGVLVDRQNLKVNFSASINKAELLINLEQITLSQGAQQKEHEQFSSSLQLHLDNPFNTASMDNPVNLKSTGNINIQQVLKVPFIQSILTQNFTHTSTSLQQSLPSLLTLDYDFHLQKKASTWTINKALFSLSQTIKDKQENIIKIKNKQIIKLKNTENHVKLITQGELISMQINRFDFNWLQSLTEQFAGNYQFSGYLNKLDSTLSRVNNEHYLLAVKQLQFKQLQAAENKKLLFNHININSQLSVDYTKDSMAINYPVLTIKHNKKHLFTNLGKITIQHLSEPDKQKILLKGSINSSINQLMNLAFIKQFTRHQLKGQSLLDADYNLSLTGKQLTIHKSKLNILHPQSKGQLTLSTQKPISLSLDNKKQQFSPDGQLDFILHNFDLTPYESLFSQSPIRLDYINGHFKLTQTAKQQTIKMLQALKISNIHFKDKSKAALRPFDISLDFSAQQKKNLTRGKIKQLSMHFVDAKETEHALDLQADFQLDLNQTIILTKFDSQLKLMLTQLIKQPAVMPESTLTQGTLNAQFSIDNEHNIKHQWLIHDLIDNKNNKIVQSIDINGSGQMNNLSSFSLKLPIIMKSTSGQSELMINIQTKLDKDQKKINLLIDGKEVFLNDLLKLLAAINPQAEIAQLDKKDENKTEQQKNTAEIKNHFDKTPAKKAFWQSGINLFVQLKINNLFYSDYMSYQDIAGELTINDELLSAKNFKMKFHESPMNLDAHLEFHKGQNKPYNIQLNTALKHFSIGDFLKELNPKHVPRADGVFDVDIKFFGALSNLMQMRNELLFDININGKNGVYHLIPSNDIMLRSSGAAMAMVGEFVSVLPSSGFGLGIVNRVIRFAKEINYDYINMHLLREPDRNTRIKIFQILSPELRFIASGGLTFKENTRLFDQPLKMTAQMNLANEGAAIFYGLDLLKDEQDEYGFWKGPVITFSGTLNHQQDNFDEIIAQAKSGTITGGITNPFSGLIGNFRYRWFGDEPDYDNVTHEKASESKSETESTTH